jgi:hypothetical protein
MDKKLLPKDIKILEESTTDIGMGLHMDTCKWTKDGKTYLTGQIGFPEGYIKPSPFIRGRI